MSNFQKGGGDDSNPWKFNRKAANLQRFMQDKQWDEEQRKKERAARNANKVRSDEGSRFGHKKDSTGTTGKAKDGDKAQKTENPPDTKTKSTGETESAASSTDQTTPVDNPSSGIVAIQDTQQGAGPDVSIRGAVGGKPIGMKLPRDKKLSMPNPYSPSDTVFFELDQRELLRIHYIYICVKAEREKLQGDAPYIRLQDPIFMSNPFADTRDMPGIRYPVSIEELKMFYTEVTFYLSMNRFEESLKMSGLYTSQYLSDVSSTDSGFCDGDEFSIFFECSRADTKALSFEHTQSQRNLNEECAIYQVGFSITWSQHFQLTESIPNLPESLDDLLHAPLHLIFPDYGYDHFFDKSGRSSLYPKDYYLSVDTLEECVLSDDSL